MEAARPSPASSSMAPPAYEEATIFPSVPTHPVHIRLPPSAPVDSAPETAEPIVGLAELELLMDMGIEREWATLALKRCSNDLDDAVMFCLENAELKQAMLQEDNVARSGQLAREAAGARLTLSRSTSNITNAPVASASSPNTRDSDVDAQPNGRFKKIFPWLKNKKNETSAGSTEIDSPVIDADADVHANAALEDETASSASGMGPVPAEEAVEDRPPLMAPMASFESQVTYVSGDSGSDSESSLYPGCDDAPPPVFALGPIACSRQIDSDEAPIRDGMFDTTSSLTITGSALLTEENGTAQESTIESSSSSVQAVDAELGGTVVEGMTSPSAVSIVGTGAADEVDEASTATGSAVSYSSYSSYSSSSYTAGNSTNASTATVPTVVVMAGAFQTESIVEEESEGLSGDVVTIIPTTDVALDQSTEHSIQESVTMITANEEELEVRSSSVEMAVATAIEFTESDEVGPILQERESVVTRAQAADVVHINSTTASGDEESEAGLLTGSTLSLDVDADATATTTINASSEVIATAAAASSAIDPFDSSILMHLDSWHSADGHGIHITPTASASPVEMVADNDSTGPFDEEVPVQASITITVRQPIRSLPRAMTVDAASHLYRIEGTEVLTADAVVGQADGSVEFVPMADAMVSIGEGMNVPAEVAGAYISDGTQLYMTIAAPMGPNDEDEDVTQPTVIPEPMRRRDQPRASFRQYLLGSKRRDGGNGARPSGIPRRILNEFTLIADPEDHTKVQNVVLTLKQPKLAPGKNSPQGNRPNRAMLKYKGLSQHEAKCLAEANVPPVWSGEGDPLECVLCLRSHGVFKPLHHCRNCGNYVCDNCSDKFWPSSMIPECYHFGETIVRTCDSCNILMESFNDALRRGDAPAAFAAYSSGNVNIHCPLTVYKSEEYPIHCAVRGGNLMLVRWLMETKHCSVAKVVRGVHVPLKTTKGVTCLGIAAYYGHSDIMRYLVQKHNCSLMEITEADVLRRGLHAVLEAPGPLPPVDGKGAWFQKKAIPHKDASEEELSQGSSHGSARAVSARTAIAAPLSGPSVRGHLVTGNPRYQNAIVASSAAVPEAPQPDLVMQTTSRPKQQYFRRKPVDSDILQRTLHALQHTTTANQTRFPSRRTSAPGVGGAVRRGSRSQVLVGSGGIPNPQATSVAPGSSDNQAEGVLTVNVPPAEVIPQIDYTQSDEEVMQDILATTRSGDSAAEVLPHSPAPRPRNITDAYIVPYSDTDVVSMSTPRR